MADRLSSLIFTGSVSGMLSTLSSRIDSHFTSLMHSLRAIYSASVEDKVMDACFFDLQDRRFSSSSTMYPYIDLREIGQEQ